MKALRWSGSVLGILLSAGWLCADSIPGDGSIALTSGGHHSTTVTGFGPTLLNGDEAITNGGGTFGIINGTGRTIEKVVLDIPTIDFVQPFDATTNLFTNATIDVEPSEDLVVVTFFGIGFASEGGSASVPKPCSDFDKRDWHDKHFDADDDCDPDFDKFKWHHHDFDDWHHHPDFDDPDFVTDDSVALTFFPGLLPGSDNTLTLAADPGVPGTGFENGQFPTVQFFPAPIPEPGTFGLLLSGAAVILGWRRLRRR